MELKETSLIKKIIDYDEFMVETGLDEDTIKELYQVFLEEIIVEKEKLLNCFSGNDFAKLGKTVHNIKGISGSYKAGLVFEQAKLLDLDIKKEIFEGIGNGLVELIKAIDSAAADIRRHFVM